MTQVNLSEDFITLKMAVHTDSEMSTRKMTWDPRRTSEESNGEGLRPYRYSPRGDYQLPISTSYKE